MKIRLIKEKDNLEVEKLIRDCLIEFGGNKPGCAWEDKDLGQFYQVYQPKNKQYLVVIKDNHVVGGCGIGPLDGIEGICELQKICDIKDKMVLVIGSGDTAVLALRYLQEYEAGKIYLCSRTLAHAGNVQKEFQEIEIISYEQRYEIMKQCDIVVSATSAPHVVVKQEYYTPEKQVTFLDLATPRDIDPKLSDDAKVNLINLDTIKEISKANQSEREELCRQSNTMISKAKEETMQWLFQAPMEETIRSLQEKCTEIVEDSYSYLSRKIDFGTREQKLLKKVLNASLQRMIKEPIQELKHLETRQEQADYKKMVEQLFGIETKKGK